MKVKELITLLLNEPMDNEIPNIKGISERGFGQPTDETYLETKVVIMNKNKYPLPTRTVSYSNKKCLKPIPEVSKIVDYYEDKLDKCACDYFNKGYKKALEKQGGITKLSEEEQNRFAKGVLTSCAMSFIYYLDAHKYEGKMCVSNGECEDIENAFHNAMWDRLHRYYCKYIEKQGEYLENYNEAEKEKAEFVGDGLIECHANFLDFKEGNTYWLEYIGDDKYNVRSDNLLGKTYHITPCQLYTVFKKLTWLEKQGEQEETLCDKCKKEQPSHSCQDITALGRCALEKQGEKNPADKVGQKFHEGEWITNGDYTWQIVEVKPLDYILQSQDGNIVNDTISHVDEQFHSFTIEDAKDCDILFAKGSYFKEYIFIYSGMTEDNVMSTYCGFDMAHNNFDTKLSRFGRMEDFEAVFPATKEQCDLLFQKMKEAGYEWDAEKKELTKIVDEEQIKKNLQDNSFRRMFEQKPAWSEDDESFNEAQKEVQFIKSLKDKMQPRQEWNGTEIAPPIDSDVCG